MAISHVENLAPSTPTKLRNRHQRRLHEFLIDDVDANLFALSWLENHGVESHRPGHFTYWGWFNGEGKLRSVALNVADRLLMLDARDADFARGFARFFRAQHIRFMHVVSRARSVEPFWDSYSDSDAVEPIGARLIQNQQLFRLHSHRFDTPTVGQSGVRRARSSELDPVFLASVKMHREETLEDPLERDATSFRRHVRYRINNGRTFVWFENRRLLFKADISTRCSYGAQISGVYTSPDVRNQGIATRAMSDICSILFAEDLPRLTLYVNQTNAAARRVYEKIGFQFLSPYKTIFVAD